MKRKWTQIVVRFLPIVVATAAVVIEFEDLTGRKWG